MPRTWSIINVLVSAFTVACSGASPSVNQDASRLQAGKMSILSSVADVYRNISQIRFDPSTTPRLESLNREFIFLHVNNSPSAASKNIHCIAHAPIIFLPKGWLCSG